MIFLTSLMGITFLGIALPILLLGLVGIWLLGLVSYRDSLIAWKTFFGLLCFGTIAWLSNFEWDSVFSWWTPVYLLAWGLLGGLWFLFKWNQLGGRQRAAGNQALATRLQEDKLRGTVSEMSQEQKRLFMLGYKPELDDNKERIFGWIILWPFSMLAYVFGDLLQDLAEWILERLRGAATHITRRHFGEFEAPAVMQTEQN